MVLHEHCFFRGVRVDVELHGDSTFRLRYGELVEYVPGMRTVRGRNSAYRFRSVEQAVLRGGFAPLDLRVASFLALLGVVLALLTIIAVVVEF